MAAVVPVVRPSAAAPTGRRGDLPRPAARTSQASPSSGVRRNPLAGGIPQRIGPRGIPTGRAVPTAREARIGERPIAVAMIGRIGPAPTATGRSAGTAIGPTGQPVRTAATGPMATVHAPRARTVIAPTVIAPTVIGANGARATPAHTGADQARNGIVRVVRARTGAVPLPIVPAGPVRVVRARTVVARRRIGIVRVVRARTVVARRRIGIVRVVRVGTRLVPIPIVAAGAAPVAKVRTAVSRPPIGIVPPTTGVVTSEIARRLGRLITIAHAQTVIVQTVIVQTVPDRIAIPPMGNVRAAKARIPTGRPPLVPHAVEVRPTLATEAIARIAVAHRGSGPSGRAAAGHPASEHREPAGIGRIPVRDPRTDRSAHRGSTGRIDRARTKTHRAAPRIAGTDRRAAPTASTRIASTRIASTRTARTRIARVTRPTNAMPRAQTAAVRTTIVPGARRVTGRGVTTAGTTGHAGTTATPAVPIIPATTGQPAREGTSVSART